MSSPREWWLESGKQDTSPEQAEVASVIEGLEWGMVAHTYNLLGRLSQED